MVTSRSLGPYAIAIGRKAPGARVWCAELNKTACKYMRENILINRLRYIVEPLCGDVDKVCRDLRDMDRVVMPLPKGGYRYLGLAIKCVKRGGIIHLYYWGKLDEAFQKARELIERECRKRKRKARILGERRVLPYGPGVWKVCIEFRVD